MTLQNLQEQDKLLHQLTAARLRFKSIVNLLQEGGPPSKVMLDDADEALEQMGRYWRQLKNSFAFHKGQS